ncbi:MAG: response regulator [Bacteroidales bacterium]|nr:response regulator [Bacteroidales bacterium]
MKRLKFISLLRRFSVPILIYFIGITLLLVLIYYEKKYAQFKKIDQKLLKASELVPQFLPPDFHDRALDSLSITPHEDWKNIMALTKYAQQFDVSFVYTLVVKNNKAYFTSCSTTPEEIKHKTTARYFTPYPEASQELLNIIHTKKVVYETTTDRWGSFRTILVPAYSPSGNFYIIGVDIDLNEINAFLRKELFYLIMSGIVLTLFFLPTIIQIIRLDRRLTNFLKRKIEERTAELSKELISHKQTTIQLQQTIKEKEEYAQKAKEALDTKTNLITTISHELRTPLNVIIGINTLLSQSNLSEEQLDYCKTIENAAKQIINLIEESMQIYYSQPERVNLELRSFELSSIINQVIQQHSQVLRHKRLQITYNIDERIPNHLIGDESFIRQILFNLLNNAIKFTDKGNITIDVEFEEILMKENKIIIIIKIKDTGSGIPSEKQKQLLKALNEDSLFNKSSGLGLGLTLSKYLAKMLQANLWFKSEENKGTEFYLRLPLQIGTANKNPLDLPLIPEDAKSEKFKKTKFHVLLAEDNELNVKVGLRSLEKFGHDVSIAKNGKEVIQLLKKHHFDVILMDIEMPEMDGLETAMFIRKHPEEVGHKNIPIIALTAHAMPSIEQKCKEAGMEHFIVKPIDFNELNNLMYKLVNKR